MSPVCFVLGAGAGVGGTVGSVFAREGYHAVLCRRSDEEGLDRLVSSIRASGGDATGFLLNAVHEGAIEDAIERVERDIGSIEVLIYNLGGQSGFFSLADTTYKTFELGWRMATFGLFRTFKTLCPLMAARGGGTILVTSATAAMRGNDNQYSHAASMGGRRMLCQAANAEFASQGVHVAHIILDGMVDAPDTTGKMMGAERFEALRDARGRDKDGLILPAEVAETYLHLARQHRSAWTFELDLRAFSDRPWWNH